MNQILDFAQSRNLGENLQDLLQINGKTEYRLNLIAYNSLLNDWFKGTLSRGEFQRGTLKIWESFFFFLNNETAENLKRFAVKTGLSQEEGRRTILYISASPKDDVRLEVDYEYKKIKAAISKGAQREKLELLSPVLSSTLEDFMNEKNKHKPFIIHFSGHGDEQSLIFATDTNTSFEITEEVLKEVFKGIGVYTKCIVLNACYTAGHAKTISEQGLYVIGMNALIPDQASVFFSEKFYGALSEGQDIQQAFYQTKTLMLSDMKDQVKILEMWKDGKCIIPFQPV